MAEERLNDQGKKLYQPMICSNYFEIGLGDAANDPPACYDPNRRSSLGAESLLEHDLNEENGNLDDCSDPIFLEAQLGLEYADDIFILNRYKEHVNHPQKYIEEQPQVTEHMRCTLINWLVKVNSELRFSPETIFIAVNLTDRFLQSTPIAQDCLQLLAVCALFVAAKLEESALPGISVLVSLCGSTYKHYHFRKMETLLLSTLKFELHSPTSWFFVTYIALKSCHLAPFDRRTLNLTRYVIETCLGSYRISQFFPSEQAASALSFSCLVTHSPNLVYPSNAPEDCQRLACKTKRSNDPFSSVKETEDEHLFEILGSLNASSSSLTWTFQNTFSQEEFRRINQCYYIMKQYMKPFLHSYSSSFGLNGVTLENIPAFRAHSDELQQNSCELSSCPTKMSSITCSVYNAKKELTSALKECSNPLGGRESEMCTEKVSKSSFNGVERSGSLVSNWISLRADVTDEDSVFEVVNSKGCNVT